MASLDDVLNALVTQAATALTGVVQPYQPPYKGMPIPEQLDMDIQAGKSHVTVTRKPQGGTVGRTAIDNYAETPPPTQTLTFSISAVKFTGGTDTPLVSATATITFSGTLTPNTFMLLFLGPTETVPYTPAPGSTPAQIATGLASAVNAKVTDFTAVAAGPQVVVTAVTPGSAGNANGIALSLGNQGNVTLELGRETDTFTISIWSPDDPTRGALCNTIDVALRQIHHLGPFPDGTYGRLKYRRTDQSDAEVRNGIYRRLLEYTVEYVTTAAITAVQVLDATATVSGTTQPLS